MDQKLLYCPELKPTDEDLKNEFMTDQSIKVALSLLQKHGYLVLRNAFNPTEIQSLFLTLNNKEYPHEFARKKAYLELAGPFNSPSLYVNNWAFPIIGTYLATCFILESCFAVASTPMANKNGNRYCTNDLFTATELTEIANDLPPQAITLAIPLACSNDPITPYQCWPGSHIAKQADGPEPGIDEGYDKPILFAGDCLILDDRVLRCETANPDQKNRWTLHFRYLRPWYRDPIDESTLPIPTISAEEFEKVPREIRSLIDHMRGDNAWRYYT
ncbi:MAG TPA: hypothetical protein VFX23_00905 [Limnobacter sp.]|uniref:hypothetical protein n=1 Tax=Limnobacter sp. TaxID=2003368 RepID=UPI002E34F717|nr:hypothetical protein [Limnobacter sp.]HEX5484532.1 hypothetical protein [Limnobacter sp.]